MLSFFPRGVLDEILNLIESVSEEFPSYSYLSQFLRVFLPTPESELIKNKASSVLKQS